MLNYNLLLLSTVFSKLDFKIVIVLRIFRKNYNGLENLNINFEELDCCSFVEIITGRQISDPLFLSPLELVAGRHMPVSTVQFQNLDKCCGPPREGASPSSNRICKSEFEEGRHIQGVGNFDECVTGFRNRLSSKKKFWRAATSVGKISALQNGGFSILLWLNVVGQAE